MDWKLMVSTRHAMIMARAAKIPNTVASRFSEAYMLPNASSRKFYSNGFPEANSSQLFFSCSTTCAVFPDWNRTINPLSFSISASTEEHLWSTISSWNSSRTIPRYWRYLDDVCYVFVVKRHNLKRASVRSSANSIHCSWFLQKQKTPGPFPLRNFYLYLSGGSIFGFVCPHALFPFSSIPSASILCCVGYNAPSVRSIVPSESSFTLCVRS